MSRLLYALCFAGLATVSPLMAQNGPGTAPNPVDSLHRASELYAWGTDGDVPHVLQLLSSAATLFHSAGDLRGEATALERLGRVHADLEDPDSALTFYRRALALREKIGDTAATTATRRTMRRPAAVELLKRSPLLEPTMGVVAGHRFVGEVRSLLATVGDSLGPGANTPQAATRALELLLGDRTVRAEIQSEPAGLVVKYRRMTDPTQRELAVTTSDTISLQPALYVFTIVDPRTGQPEVQNKDCATPCTVRFNLRRRPN
jgi:hypothetical protein